MSPANPVQLWLKGIAAAVITGASGGILNAFTAIGIRPDAFNLGLNLHDTLKLAGGSAVVTGLIGLAAYLQKSPVPNE